MSIHLFFWLRVSEGLPAVVGRIIAAILSAVLNAYDPVRAVSPSTGHIVAMISS